jgi:hypothetical protein
VLPFLGKNPYNSAKLPEGYDEGIRRIMQKTNRVTPVFATLLTVTAALGLFLHAEATPNKGNIATPKSNAAPKKQDDVVTISLYRGQEIAASNLKLGGWGSGTATETKENTFVGDNAIKITTHGLYQGGRLEFKTPVDIAAAIANKNTYMRFQLRFNPQGNLTEAFNPLSGGSTQRLGPIFERMRYLVRMVDGKQYEIVRPFELPPSDDVNAYVPFSFPIQMLVKAASKTPGGAAKLSGDGAKIQSVTICGDKYQQFTLGEAEIITDDTEIDVADLDEQIVFFDNDTTFVGNAQGGASTLRFTWDFDAADGVQEQGIGRSTTYVYRPRGLNPDLPSKKYTVTLRVSDLDGIKERKEKTVEIEVSR